YTLSHVASIRLQITELDALKKACAGLGLEFKENQKTFKWYGTWVNDYNAQDAAYRNGIKTQDYGKCTHALSVAGNPDAYEVGLMPNPNGKGFVPVFDFYGAQGAALAAKIGRDGGLLKQA